MRFQARFCLSLAVAALAVCAAAHSQESSSSQSSAQTPTTQPSPAYIAIDPLAKVRYDNRYDLYVGLAYDHLKAGPNLLEGSNLGGIDLCASYWLTRHWGLQGSGRSYLGTSGAAPNSAGIKGPFVAQYLFVAGPEWLGPHNKHGDLIAHVLVGGAYGDFEKDLRGLPASTVAFYNTQVAPAMILGGHIDLNRSAHWVFRMTPDAVLTDYSINYGKKNRQIDVNAAFSVGVEYKFSKKR